MALWHSFTLTVLVTLFVGLSSCDQRQATIKQDQRFGGPTPADSLFFSIERSPCFGRCPIYKLYVYRDGSATFHGKGNTTLMGAYRTSVDQALMIRLLDEANRIKFFELDDNYDGQVTDLPTCIVHVVGDGMEKRVRARYRVPEQFTTYARMADSLLLPLPWVPDPNVR